MQTVLIVVHLMIVAALIGLILIQRSEGGGLGIGGGSGFMSARGASNALTRTTAILATLFFVTSLSMGILARYQSSPTDILDNIPLQEGGQQNGILDSLGPTADPNAVPTTDGASSSAVPTTAPVTEAPATDNNNGETVPTGQ